MSAEAKAKGEVTGTAKATLGVAVEDKDVLTPPVPEVLEKAKAVLVHVANLLRDNPGHGTCKIILQSLPNEGEGWSEFYTGGEVLELWRMSRTLQKAAEDYDHGYFSSARLAILFAYDNLPAAAFPPKD